MKFIAWLFIGLPVAFCSMLPSVVGEEACKWTDIDRFSYD
jgi:hypothetical protein